MEALVYFVVWGALIFLMMRFGCGAHVMGHGGHSTAQDGEIDRTGGAELRLLPPDSDTVMLAQEGRL